MYNTLLKLSRNIFFYKKIQLKDNFETRIYLMFIHFSIMMIIFKKKGKKFSQESYDALFNNIEYNLREMGYGDVAVNKKMKDLNKLLYDILLKIEKTKDNKFKINEKLIFKYFGELKLNDNVNYFKLEEYLINFYDFCFDISPDSMIRGALEFGENYGST